MMKTAAATLCFAAVFAGCWPGAAAWAEDLSLSGADQYPGVSQKLGRDINNATGSLADRPSGDVEAQIRDLEASRAAVEQRKTPAVSLSVSGSVSQEMQYKVGR